MRMVIIYAIYIIFVLQLVDSRPASAKDQARFIASKFKLPKRISTVLGNETSLPSFTFSAPNTGISGLNVGFVQPQGTVFALSTATSVPWYCAGSNAYYAALKWIMSENEVSVMFREHAQRGVTAMRVFAHSSFDSVSSPMMPSFGTYNEDAIKRLDLALALAAQNGIRLILVLGNYWPFLGGMQQWVDKGVGPGRDIELFFTDPFLKKSYKDWVQHLVTRTNVLTGQKYIDDPTIMAWELLNEPRTSSKYEVQHGLPPGKLICDWVGEMSSFIKYVPAFPIAIMDYVAC